MKLATRETCPGAARWGVIATLVLAPLTQALALSYTCAGGQTQTSFTDASPPGTSTGTVQSFTVPPEVTDITIDAAGEWPYHALLVRGDAAVEMLEDVSDEYAAAARRYFGDEQGDAWVQQLSGQPMARITVTPSWVGVLDFETRFPSALSM